MGKPLISDAAMRGMYRTMQHLRDTKHASAKDRSIPRAERATLLDAPEALYAALASQLHPRDKLVTEGASLPATTAMTSWFGGSGRTPRQLAMDAGPEETAAAAAGLALADSLRASTTDTTPETVPPANRPVVLALLHGFPSLAGALALMQQYQLSLVLIVQGEPLGRAEALRRSAATQIPILPVDDSDAVAVCRVLQETLLRARHGWGGAVLHATRLDDAEDPLAGMEQRLRNRGLWQDATAL